MDLSDEKMLESNEYNSDDYDDEVEDAPLEIFESFDGVHQFTFTLNQFETDDTKVIKGIIKIGSNEVGSLEGYLIERKCGNFYTDCDAISSELQLLANVLCYSTGKVRRDVWSKFNQKTINSCSTGGFLNISIVNIVKNHRGKDLAYLFLKELFEKLKSRWTLCVVVPFYYDIKRDEFPEAIINKKNRNICELFARFGFLQFSKEHPKYWFLLPSKAKNLKKSDVSGITIVVPFESSSYPTDPLLDCLLNGKQGDIDQLIPELISKGLDINGSFCLHFASNQGHFHIVKALVKAGADVNLQNVGLLDTPLHAAARGSSDCIDFLCQQPGIDLFSVNCESQTPYDVMCSKINGLSCFWQAFNIKIKYQEVESRYTSAMALMPASIKDVLVNGLISPRMFKRLANVAMFEADIALDGLNDIKFVNRQRTQVDDCFLGCVFDTIPEEVTNGGVFKSFITGYCQLLQIVASCFSCGKLPTKCFVLECAGWPPNHKYYLENGGEMRYIYEGIINRAKESSWEYGDGDLEESVELDVLPKVLWFDDDWQYMETVVLQYLLNH